MNSHNFSMPKALTIALACMFSTATIWASDIKVKHFMKAGPIEIAYPIMIDSTNAASQTFDIQTILDSDLTIDGFSQCRKSTDEEPLKGSSKAAIYMLRFNIDNETYASTAIKVEGLSTYRLAIDGASSDGRDVRLTPGSHNVTIKCLVKADSTEYAKVTLTTADSAKIEINNNTTSLYNINNVVLGEHLRSVSLSPSGRFAITLMSTTDNSGKATWTYRLTDWQTNRIITTTTNQITWLTDEDLYYESDYGAKGKRLTICNPLTGERETVSEQMPNDYFYLLPNRKANGNKMILSHMDEGTKDDADVHEFITPDDRQPGWRNRYNLYLFDPKTGLKQPLTYGHRNIYINDVSSDGRLLLASISESILGERPTERSSIMLIDLETMTEKMLIEKDGFIASALFSPDAKQILVKGSPEAFGGIGKNLPEGMTPSMYDYQLYIMDIATKKVNPITRQFNPSIEQFLWNKADGMIYFTANDRDCVNLFQCNTKKNYKIEKINLPEEVITSLSIAQTTPTAAIIGESANNASRLYQLNLKTLRPTIKDDTSARRLKEATLGECRAWDFVNSKGDTICGRYYLPPHFDKTKKYPMIVYYYGGCSPVPRNFDTRYPFHTYAAQGYIVYVLQPSGCAGFGQEFAARHVNTAGQGPAEDIIEGTKQFCKEHTYVNEKKIGCMGASYGGFMTQYLQTQTDIFAAAVSHAGISNHTSYWGEGYWGYSYSQVSMANSYPWTRKDLYVDQSPLFNADKINTPILFLHGTADTNVPIGESLQMYTALKLLNKPTALVVVEGENHGINEYSKRMKWQQTIYAWFAKWLKDDDAWWNAMYPKKNL